MKNIIVDLDNTLWDFASVFEERLRKIAPTIPPMGKWEWDFYKHHISLEQLHHTIDSIHIEQDRFKPFPSSKRFLDSLHESGFEITIASHRHAHTREATISFLKKYDLPYTDLHISHDKTVLFDTSDAIIDDAPKLLDEAKNRGLICTGLRYPWNKHLDHPLFESLEDILEYVLREFS
jgi:phosphoglycolate phosphatase-like HAD superfamily hydrolase